MIPWSIKKLFSSKIPISYDEANHMRETIMTLQRQLARKLPASDDPFVKHQHPLLEDLKTDLCHVRITLEKIMSVHLKK